ncbi:DoxX family membrane protein [Micromonospora fiedleri]|uniref:DoxX family membrane protein n=2 Tax=Micromonosporaceae TaxID=28056 RepID=A0ABS1UME7_9ACTN|nr:DoxX family membrane protein [Micromonospora fiedleri]
MTIHHNTQRSIERPLERAEMPGSMLTTTAARALAVLRVATGLIFGWAFLDKMFGLGYSTPTERAWINGGSPTKGFLANVDVGPFQSIAHSIAGAWWANLLFMVGLAAIGVALLAGIGLRIAAASGSLMMALMWLADFPLARFNAAGDPTGSTNPVVDSHLMYAVVLVVLAAAYAGHTWGLGRRWAQLPFVQRNRWML